MSEWKPIDCAPDPHMLESLRKNCNFAAWKAIAEVIDNSFDWGAKRVCVDRSGNCLTISDDGDGCSNIANMVRLGAHFRNASAGMSLGRYGIGLKESSIWLCSRMVIQSATDKTSIEAVADWDEMIKSKQWICNSRDVHNLPRGTTIRFEKLIKNRVRYWDICERRVQELFTPGLLEGRQILWDGKPLPPCDPPILESRIEVEGTYDGKQYELIAGIIPKKSPVKNGYRINYHHRVIASEITQFGFGEFSSGRIFAQVSLFDAEKKWDLSRFKDGIDDLEHFLESLLPTIKPLLEKVKAEESRLDLARIGAETEAMVNDAILGIKEKRPNKAGETASESLEKTGRRRRHSTVADDTDVGSVVKPRRQIEKIKIAFDWTRPGEIGRCDGGRTTIVHINPDHSFIKSLLSDGKGVYQVAIALLGGHLITQPDDSPMWAFAVSTDLTGYDRFVRNISHWLEQIKTTP